jgi:hypothetical protein
MPTKKTKKTETKFATIVASSMRQAGQMIPPQLEELVGKLD